MMHRYSKIFRTQLFKSRLYYLFIIVLYFVLAFVSNSQKILFENMNNVEFCFVTQQAGFCFLMVLLVSIFLNDSFLSCYKNILLIRIQKPYTFFMSMFVVLSMCNLVPFVIGTSVNYVFQSALVPTYLLEGYGTFLIKYMLMGSIEIVTCILFAMSLILLTKRLFWSFLIYVVSLLMLMIPSGATSNLIVQLISLPMSVRGIEALSSSPVIVILSRMIYMCLAICMFSISIRMFVGNKKH